MDPSDIDNQFYATGEYRKSVYAQSELFYTHACKVASKPLFEEFPEDTTAVEGNKVLLPVKIIGSPQPTLTWYHDNTRLGNDYAHEISSDGSLTIITAEMRHSGTYRLVATNSEGTVEKQFSLKVINEENEEPPLATAAEVIQSSPVPVAEFGQYVSQNHANSNNGFTTLYKVYYSHQNIIAKV